MKRYPLTHAGKSVTILTIERKWTRLYLFFLIGVECSRDSFAFFLLKTIPPSQLSRIRDNLKTIDDENCVGQVLVRSLVTKFLGNLGLISQACDSGANQCCVFHVYNLVEHAFFVYEIVFQIILNTLLERL